MPPKPGLQNWQRRSDYGKLDPLTADQLEFIEWLVDPHRQGTQADWARAHGLSQAALTMWKRKAHFREAWDRRLAELNVSPERIQRVLDALWEKACEGDARAANLYLQYTERFIPKRAVVVEDRSIKDLSDTELAALMRQTAAQMEGERFNG